MVETMLIWLGAKTHNKWRINTICKSFNDKSNPLIFTDGWTNARVDVYLLWKGFYATIVPFWKHFVFRNQHVLLKVQHLLHILKEFHSHMDQIEIKPPIFCVQDNCAKASLSNGCKIVLSKFYKLLSTQGPKVTWIGAKLQLWKNLETSAVYF